MEKKNILLVGENPFSMSGNGNMMQALSGKINLEKYNITCFCRGAMPDIYVDPLQPLPLRIICADPDENGDPWGKWKLLNLISTEKRIDLVVFVGIDAWVFGSIYKQLAMLQKNGYKFKTMGIFPYDSPYERKEWIDCFKMIDFPFVYSFDGYKRVKKACEKVSYFRPPLLNSEEFKPLPKEEVSKYRAETFPTCTEETFLIGFVGNNQHRKCPQIHIEAFAEILRSVPVPVHFYMHTDLDTGVYNLKQVMKDFNIPEGGISSKVEGMKYTAGQMNILYNSFNLLVNCTSQEGLSWTPIEAALAGTPTLLSDSTAHKDFPLNVFPRTPCFSPYWIPAGVGMSIKSTLVRANCCHPSEIADDVICYLDDLSFEPSQEELVSFGQNWLAGETNINTVFDTIFEKKQGGIVKANPRRDEILFVQHSAAGDVLMSTQCFEGLKARHKGKKLVYMTQEKFHDILVNNPYVDEIIPWDEEKLSQFIYVYNPHGERILPGGFNNLDDTLYSMYPYFCKVEPGKMFIKKSRPSEDIADLLVSQPYIVVQTSGGDKRYRTYEHFEKVLALSGIGSADTGLGVVQIGGTTDRAIRHQNTLDLRGRLTFRESAWVMSRAKAALLIDSFPAHLAGALGTPAVVLFGPAPARVTRPRDDKGVITNLEPNKKDVCPNLTSCWGEANRMACSSPCINTINPFTVSQALKEKLS